MKAARLIKEARDRGADVYLKGDQAAVRVQLPDPLIAAMREVKTAIVEELRREAAAKPIYDPDLLQREANQRNAQAVRDGLTDRWCACGRLATMAWPDGAGRNVWQCHDCAPTAGKA